VLLAMVVLPSSAASEPITCQNFGDPLAGGDDARRAEKAM
jgi:hypothetical protein